MKQILHLSIATLLALSLQAQTPAGGDPFVKASATAAEDQAAAEKNPPTLLMVYEVYALPQESALEVLLNERGGPARYRRVAELLKAGTARLETLSAVAGKSGQKSVLESADEVRYPSEFSPAEAAPAKPDEKGNPVSAAPPLQFKPGVANDFAEEVHNAGDTLELEPTLSPDGRLVDLSIAPQRTTLRGFRDFPGQAGGPTTTRPAFDTQKLQNTSVLALGQTAFLGTFSPPPNPEALAETWLMFLRALPVPAPVAPAKKPAAIAGPRVIELTYTFYSCARADALPLLGAWPEPETPWAKLQALLHEKKARCERVATLVTTPGQRVVTEEIQEVPYAAGYAPALADGTGGMATAFEVRDAGLFIEAEPLLSEDGLSVDLNHAPRMLIERGPLERVGSVTKFPPTLVFEHRSLRSAVTFSVGQQMLAGTFNAPPADGVNGRANDGRTWLLFVRCEVSAP